MESNGNGAVQTRPPNDVLSAEERRQIREQLLAELAESTLEPWAADLCRIVARSRDAREYFVGSKVSRRMVNAASALADRKVDRTELKAVMGRRAWLELWQRERPKYLEADVQSAKEDFLGLLPKGLSVYHKSLDHLRDTLDGDDVIVDEEGKPVGLRDKLGAVRAAAPLLSPIVAHALPRKQEVEEHRTQVIIHLTAAQTTGLDAPVMVVQADEVKTLPPET